jgi:hypothetical protein
VKLSKTQAELLEAVNGGAILYYMPSAGSFIPRSYYFRSDTMSHCTAAAKALKEKGLVREVGRDMSGRHQLVKAV